MHCPASHHYHYLHLCFVMYIIVLLNAAAGIVVGGQAETLKDGLESAKKSVDSGAALNILNQLAG